MPEPVDLGGLLGRPAVEVAPELLGAEISCAGVTVRLTEVEAYAGPLDPGSHAFRRTARSEIMYGPPGFLYCYLIYGLHVCANVVTGEPEEAGAILLRAGVVTEGETLVQVRRPGVPQTRWARGPALLCRTLGIGLADNGADLTGDRIRLHPRSGTPPEMRSGPRVGLRRGARSPWRFWVPGDPTVSAYRAAPRRFDPPPPLG